ncbi:PREDICTED: tyrosine-protein kinase receptor Tie-1 isoform X1 [Nanorana parkeri]|uniref:tyrosine-protein kinase receptor Tie-1 isoform X1 n=1 Tax=Nanorana parkeri TaxID=125878 RepID=UPI0008541A03|nr:PREDICTED: tyrosine-protein kinase receptor Tie-1 isoform X1 [Nanorana parkeri]
MLRFLLVLGLFFTSLLLKTGAVLDVTLVSVASEHRRANLTLSCITGEREMQSSDLSIERDNTIVKIAPIAPSHTRSHDNELQVRFTSKALVGVFFCIAKGPTEQTKILYPYNSPSADLTPLRVTVTVSINQDANLEAKVTKASHADIMWKYNGTFFQNTYKNEISDMIARLTLQNVQLSQAGVYSGGFTGATPLANAFFRLIVRGCPENKWGPSCQKDCLGCLNGGVCHDVSGECICAPGFMGTRCEKACREGNFGRNCQETCKRDQGCKGLTFCLPDPYGCSCGSGWTGAHCQKECPAGTYGANCALRCECESGGSCNRFSGCVCANGYHGQHCEKSDHHPQIIDLPSQVEFNLNYTAVLTCAASGNPQPVLGSIVLRRPDGSVITASNALLDSERSTCTFTIPTMTLNDNGLWECRVSTSGGQDNRKFRVEVKVPPAPLEPPRLLERRSRQLIMAPLHHFSGDGPILSIKVLYQPMGMKSDRQSLIVEPNINITLPNLNPVTAYLVRYQLSRPGSGGEGPLGPIAVLETDCIEPTVKPEIKGYSKEDRHTININWQLPTYSSVGSGFLVRVYHPPNRLIRVENVTSMDILSTGINGLSSNTEYIFRVFIYHCTSLGPPSDPYVIMLNSKGPSPPKDVLAIPLSQHNMKLIWSPPDDPNGGIIKYTVERRRLGVPGEQQWADTEGHNQTWYIITGLNTSTIYQFRVRASSRVPGEWSRTVIASTYSEESHLMVPSMESRNPRTSSSGQQLILAIIGSVSVTCFTIIVALLALFCIKKNLFHRRKMFTYQSGSGEETILQFSSGTLTLTRRPRPQTEPFSYPILEWGDIKFEDVIGEGNFGQVVKAMIKKDGVRMNAAIKMLKEFASENDHRDFSGELEVLCKLGHHPNIINLLGACENRGYLYIATEYAPFGNLLDFLRKSRVLETDPAFAKEHGTASTLSSQQLLQFASDVAKGMQYLSEKQFIHRDLAARNILVGENLVGKIADFGLSRGEEVYVKKTMGRLPVRWMAIESLNYSVYTTKSDVWSFGVLLWEIVSLGGTPYCGMTCAELYENLPQGYRMEKPRNCDDEVYDLMRQCWRDRPYERPTFNQISLQLIRMLDARKAYVNTALFENFTYAGIDATAEEA